MVLLFDHVHEVPLASLHHIIGALLGYLLLLVGSLRLEVQPANAVFHRLQLKLFLTPLVVLLEHS